MIVQYIQQNLGKIKWFCTGLMFLGAVFTSLQIFIGLNFALLAIGNGAWAIILIKIREWAAASVFVVMSATWTIGLIKWTMI